MKLRGGWITHKFGKCQDCNWECSNYRKNVLALARSHAVRKKHCAIVEVARAYHYDFREAKS